MSSDYELTAPCQPDPRGERQHLARHLPQGVLPGLGSAGDPASCAVLAWARSGLMHLTGLAPGPPLAPAAPVLPRAGAVVSAIAELTSRFGHPVWLDLDHVLAFRASFAGWERRGTVSANGTCRILRAADGWLAVNLARPSDLDCVPALLGRDLRGDPWAELTAEASVRAAAGLAAAAQVLGIPAAALGGTPAAGSPPTRAARSTPAPQNTAAPQSTPAPAAAPVRMSRLGAEGKAPRVVLDLSAMWAGPLCAHILGRAGWRVVKVEDVHRPDGARSWLPAFYGDLHAGHESVVLDFATAGGRAELARLADCAGLVIEASRPRALRRLGIVAGEWLAARPGRIWVSITGYGREDPDQRVAFGDDAAAAGGLVAWASDGTPAFCGDAIADPLTGLHAGLAALAAHAAGGGWLADVAMAGVCADMVRPAGGPVLAHPVSEHAETAGSHWTVRHGTETARVRVP